MFFPNQTHHKNTNLATQELKPKSLGHKWKQEEKIKLNTNRMNEEKWTQSNHQTQINPNSSQLPSTINTAQSPKFIKPQRNQQT